MSLDPVNYALLSLVFPTFKLPSNQLDQSVSLKIMTTLVTTTNLLLMMSLSIIYGLYQLDQYNPWCNEDLTKLKFEEEIFSRCFWFFFVLFLTATLPTMCIYLTTILRYDKLLMQVLFEKEFLRKPKPKIVPFFFIAGEN